MIILVVFIFVVCVGYFVVNRNKNPYIKSHVKKWEIEKQYEEYLNWLDDKGGDVPINKIYYNEELNALNEINNSINDDLYD